MNFVANHATAGVQEGPPVLWFLLASVLAGMSSVALLWVFRGQMSGLLDVLPAGHRDDVSVSQRVSPREEAIALLVGMLCLTFWLGLVLDAVKTDLLQRSFFSLLAFFAGALFMFFLALIAEKKLR